MTTFVFPYSWQLTKGFQGSRLQAGNVMQHLVGEYHIWWYLFGSSQLHSQCFEMLKEGEVLFQ